MVDSLDAEKNWLVTIIEAEDLRSLQQNKLQMRWYKQLEQQGDMSANDYRILTKLNIGVPLLCAEDEYYRIKFNKIKTQVDYETLLLIMQDYPVTSIMTVKQKVRFIDEMYRYWTANGFTLTIKGINHD